MVGGTARETTALRRQPLRSSHLRKPFQGRSSYATVSVPPSWVTTSGGPSTSETSRRAEPSSVPTTFTAPLTMRTWSSLTGSSKVSFLGSATDHSDMVLTSWATGRGRAGRIWGRDTPYRVS